MKFYPCPMCCNKSFTSQQDLKEHLAKANSPMKCPACSKSFKNVLFLIKHLDQCTVCDEEKKSPTKDYTGFSGSSINMDLNLEEDDDDVEGYFCTVCDIKISEVEEHVRKYHNGQEVILQDDDDDEDIDSIPPSEVQYSSPDNSDSRSPVKRKYDEMVNGTSGKDRRAKAVRDELYDEGTDGDEVFYCPKCDMNFLSLSEHTANYHKDLDVLVKDVSILDLFSSSRQRNGTFVYQCSCCQKSIVRTKTLAKHLKLFSSKDNNRTSKSSKHHNNCKKSKSLSSSSLENSCAMRSEIDEQSESDAVYELEEVKPDTDMYEFDDGGHSIFSS